MRILYVILFCIFNTCGLFARNEDVVVSSYSHLVRVSIVKTSGSHLSPISAFVSSPIMGKISNTGVPGDGISDTIVGVPRLIGENLAMLVFDIDTPTPSTKARTVHITNGLGYDRTMDCGPNFHFQEAIPLNPAADTVISIIITD